MGHFWPHPSLGNYYSPLIPQNQIVQRFSGKQYTYTNALICSVESSLGYQSSCSGIKGENRIMTLLSSEHNINLLRIVVIDTHEKGKASIRLAYQVNIDIYEKDTGIGGAGSLILRPIPIKTYIVDADTGEILYSS